MRKAESTSKKLLLLPLVPTLALGIVEFAHRDEPAPIVAVETMVNRARDATVVPDPPIGCVFLPRESNPPPPLELRLQDVTISTVSF